MPETRSARAIRRERRAPPWLPILEWTGILLPLAVPLERGLHRAESRPARSLIRLFPVWLGLFPAAVQFAPAFWRSQQRLAAKRAFEPEIQSSARLHAGAPVSYIILQGCVLR